MKILQVIHGYPMRYNAGSEVYTQTLCRGLVQNGHAVQVFTREEDPFRPDYALRREVNPGCPEIVLHLINLPRNRDRYRHPEVDHRFADLLERWRPDIVHVGHLNHLSTALVSEAAAREIPVLHTLHDYWLLCPRGQLMQMRPEKGEELWAVCDGQEDRKCAERCYARYFSGASDEWERDVAHWSDWVGRRMAHVKKMAELVDCFIAPSRFLADRFRDHFAPAAGKLVCLDYGFDRKRLKGRKRIPDEPFAFGYIGTHIPAKGIHHLLQAFGQLQGNPRLRIWGRPRGEATAALRAIAGDLPGDAATRVEWMGEYRNEEVVADVFNRVDAIVTPSIWLENSPLVIHEAQQARLPVIAADAGGMAEHVGHEVNGLLFEHRNPAALAAQMQRLVEDPALARRLGARGSIHSENGDIPAIDAHVRAVEGLYAEAVARRDAARATSLKTPWRITLDTNPDTCNLHCVMCEEHSLHSALQSERKAAKRPVRLMPVEMLRKVVAEAAANGELREIIPSTMGEPLLYKHFDEIVDLCEKYGVKLNLTTNGTFPQRGARAWAKRIVPVGSDVKISWNGATARTQEQIMPGPGRRPRWEKRLNDLSDFIAVRDAHAAAGGNRCRVTLQLTFLESNVGELADIVRMAVDYGVDRVKGHHLWDHFAEIKSLSLRRSPDAVRRWNRAAEKAHAAAAERRLPNGKPVALENFDPLAESISGESEQRQPAAKGPCPFLGQEAWISAEGRFNPCCAPDEKRRALGDFGNLAERGLGEIWNGPEYRALVKNYRNRALCQDCLLRRPAAAAADGTA